MSKHRIATIVLAGLAAATWAAGTSRAADKPKMFDLSSPAFKDGSMLPKKFAGNNPQNKSCDGENVSPPLRWSNAPAGTKSFGIILYDTTGRPPLGVVHWLAYDIPATKTSFKEGETSKPGPDFKGGKSTMGLETYFGPCPPMGDKPHPYVFTLFATDLAPGTLDAGMTREELADALKGHIVGETSLISRYGH